MALSGPRQVGKTTLARSLGETYFDLEQPEQRSRLDVLFPSVAAGEQLAILDEAQEWPELFPRIRGAIDEDRGRNGRFLLLGSVSPGLMRNLTESLAGRLSLVELTPLLLAELEGTDPDVLWLRGGYPDGGILDPRRFPRWQRSYLDLLAQRDLPNWGLPAKPQVTGRLLKMLAALHGQRWNASRLGQSLGLDSKTVTSYLDFLEGAFLIRRLPPFLPNVRKRLTRSPKIFFRDSGLLHALLLAQDFDDLLARPWVGASWEGFVIDQVIGTATTRGRLFDPYYFRTSDGHELDLVLDFGREVWAIEIKLTSAPAPGDLSRLKKVADLAGASRQILVSRVAKETRGKDVLSTNLEGLIREI
ncbi:MAG: ATP-binding protein [Planctomycetota bacterium]